MPDAALTCPRCVRPLPGRLDLRFCPHCGLPEARQAAGDTSPLEVAVGDIICRVLERVAFGSVCAIYRCRITPGRNRAGSEVQGLLKVARDPRANHLVASEAKVLRHLHSADGTGRFAPFLPRVEASVALADAGSHASPSARQANVLRMDDEIRSPDELYTLAEVRAHYPAGLDSRHVAWIWRRLLTVLGFAHLHGFIHSAVLPMHVLIEPRGHRLLLIDWCCATRMAGPRGQPLTVIAGGYLDWYRRCGGARRPPMPDLDIALAARCMIELLGGDPLTARVPPDVEPGLARYFFRCLATSSTRADAGAWKLLDDFDRLIAVLWGPRRFVPLAMPPKRRCLTERR